ncbi:MAG: peptide ABC transporter substrate-binding protein [Chloroflexi bacterium]|nr:peptide ABC transporter substrate-binding protein [Chloroflexota bacterium]
MHRCLWHGDSWRVLVVTLFFGTMLIFLTACGGGTAPSSTVNGTPTLANKQVLTFPNVGTTDIATLDPALVPDQNSTVAANMIYTGLVKSDKNLNVIPDQATWRVSPDNKVYTFAISPDVAFSDGTLVTAQSYIYSWTRALWPSLNAPNAFLLEKNIVGATDVASGKTKVLSGLKALDSHTLQVTLTQPTAYFLQALTNVLFFPVNQKVVEQYGQKNWAQHVADNPVGTGPFIVKEWDHNVKMIFVPNPHYYGNKPRLTEVDMIFVNDPATAFKAYRAGQYDFVWDLLATDQVTAKGMPGFIRTPLLQTDLLFFDNTTEPFNNSAVRQAFAYATDKTTLVHNVFKDAVAPAPTIIPPGMPGYQPNYPGLAFDSKKAKSLLESVYPDVTKVPAITFSYPNSQVTSTEAAALQQMWQTALGIQVALRPVELTAYIDETQNHDVQFGFTQWTADFPDPYDWLALNLLSTSSYNNGRWSNADFDQTITQAETLTGDARISLYNKAEQIAVSDVGWLPLDHETLAAVIPSWVHNVTLNGNGLYFGDWSDVYLLQH